MEKFKVTTYQAHTVELSIEADTAEQAITKAKIAVENGCYEDGLPIPRSKFNSLLATYGWSAVKG